MQFKVTTKGSDVELLWFGIVATDFSPRPVVATVMAEDTAVLGSLIDIFPGGGGDSLGSHPLSSIDVFHQPTSGQSYTFSFLNLNLEGGPLRKSEGGKMTHKNAHETSIHNNDNSTLFLIVSHY